MVTPRVLRTGAMLLVWLGFSVPTVHAADGLSESVITATLPGRSISALVTHLQDHDTFQHAIVLMPGSPGIMKIESAESFGMKGNFLIRARRHWLDRKTLVFSVDAPSDEWAGFTVRFRSTERYAQDIRALVGAIRAKYGTLPLTIVGTSEGSISAYYAALAVPGKDTKVIFSSSLFLSSRVANGLAVLDFDNFPIPMLWVHHESDPCRFTPYHEAQRMAQRTRAPLITVKSSNAGQGNPCEARSPHGFIGAERETVQVMKAWALTGVVGDVVMP